MIKNLVYYFYLKSSDFLDETSLYHLNCLKHYSQVFDGEKIIYISTDWEVKEKKQILDLFNFLGPSEFKFVKNDPELRESKYFIESINRIKNRDSITFFAHSKGLTTVGDPDGMEDWISSMYFFNLESSYLKNIENSLSSDFTFAGILRKNVSCPPCVFSPWHYSGTFFWFSTEKVFRKSLDFWKYGRFEVESFPGNHSQIEESFCDIRFSYNENLDLRYSDFWRSFFENLRSGEIVNYGKFKRITSGDDLTKITNYIGSDKGDLIGERHSYSKIYNRIFSFKRNSPVDILEIGIKDPRFPYASIKIWDTYFKSPNIIGLDISNSKELEKEIPNFEYRFLDQYSEESHEEASDSFLNEGMKFDYIIDDGPHYFEAQVNSFKYFFNFLKSDGFYIIEDLHVDRRMIDFLKTERVNFDVYCDDKLVIIKNN